MEWSRQLTRMGLKRFPSKFEQGFYPVTTNSAVWQVFKGNGKVW